MFLAEGISRCQLEVEPVPDFNFQIPKWSDPGFENSIVHLCAEVPDTGYHLPAPAFFPIARYLVNQIVR